MVSDAAEQEVAATAAAQLPESEPVGEAGRGAIRRSSVAPLRPGVSAEWARRDAGRRRLARGLAALEDDLVDILGLVQLKAPLHA